MSPLAQNPPKLENESPASNAFLTDLKTWRTEPSGTRTRPLARGFRGDALVVGQCSNGGETARQGHFLPVSGSRGWNRSFEAGKTYPAHPILRYSNLFSNTSARSFILTDTTRRLRGKKRLPITTVASDQNGRLMSAATFPAELLDKPEEGILIQYSRLRPCRLS